jgi:hypothetical protein
MLVQLTKLVDDDGRVEYLFLVAAERPGRLALRKHDGELELLEACPDDPDDEILVTVAIALRGHWRSGLFPETASIRHSR